jgi:GT2 family glycosyltransferase
MSLSKRYKISIIITTWNGQKILKNNLPAVLKNSPEAQEIIVIDNGSKDQSISYLKTLQKKDKRLKIIQLKKNRGFGYASNLAVKKAKGELVVLLNNDVSPHPDYLKHVLPHFSDPQLFGVSFSEGDWSWAKIYWANGYFQHCPGPKTKKAHLTAWLSGGSSIIRRNLFIKLGGFDELYHPFYWEDVDLGYRALKSGYRLLWEPRSRVDHKHETTISRFEPSFINRVRERNQLLFIWKNISDSRLLFTHRLALISRTLFGPNYIKVILSAHKRFKHFPQETSDYPLSDRQVFDLFL